jgi:hypothetical protein
MKIKFMYDIGEIHKVGYKEIQSTASDEDIKAMFSIAIGIPYRDNFCTYEIIQEGD